MQLLIEYLYSILYSEEARYYQNISINNRAASAYLNYQQTTESNKQPIATLKEIKQLPNVDRIIHSIYIQ